MIKRTDFPIVIKTHWKGGNDLAISNGILATLLENFGQEFLERRLCNILITDDNVIVELDCGTSKIMSAMVYFVLAYFFDEYKLEKGLPEKFFVDWC